MITATELNEQLSQADPVVRAALITTHVNLFIETRQALVDILNETRTDPRLKHALTETKTLDKIIAIYCKFAGTNAAAVRDYIIAGS